MPQKNFLPYCLLTCFVVVGSLLAKTVLFATPIVNLNVNPEQTTLGAAVTYQVRIEFTEEVSLSEPNWKQLTWANVERIPPLPTNPFQKIWHTSWILYPLEEGTHQIPPMELQAVSHSGNNFIVKLPQKKMIVKTLWNQQEPPKLKPFKTIQVIETSSSKLLLTGISIGVGIFLLVGFIFWKHHQKKPSEDHTLSPKETLLKNLNELQGQDTHQPLEHSQYAATLHTIIKQTLNIKTTLQTESMTQQEIESWLPKFFDNEQTLWIAKILNFLESIQYAKISLSLLEKDQMTKQTADFIHLCLPSSNDDEASQHKVS